MTMTMREEFETFWGPLGQAQTSDPKDNALHVWRWCWMIAYRAGQEAMRERAAKEADWTTDYVTANRIRALPIE